MEDDRAPDPWGLADPPAPYEEQPLPQRLAQVAGLTAPREVAGDFEWPRPEELPEVAALVADGWQVLDTDQLEQCLLPAVWPQAYRCWVPNRLPQVFTSFDGTTTRVLPVSMRRHESYDWPAEWAEQAGLPAPPPGRIWLLRSPWPWLGFSVLLSLLRRRSQSFGSEDSARALVQAGSEILGWSSEQLEAWWTGPEADAAAAWAANGRYGDDVAELVVRALGPAQLELLAAQGLDEQQIIAWADSTDLQGVPLVAAVARWRGRGLPADPPEHLSQLREWPDEQVDAWLGAGFDVQDLQHLTNPYDGVLLSLGDALQWRQAGFGMADAAQLIGADPVVQPWEGAAFRQAGFDQRSTAQWLQAGFGADEAVGWTDAGLSVQRARLWRSCGHLPTDVGPDEIFPPGWSVGAWFGRHPKDDPDAILTDQDPPGTRGRAPSRWA